jgi:hypothetical protein
VRTNQGRNLKVNDRHVLGTGRGGTGQMLTSLGRLPRTLRLRRAALLDRLAFDADELAAPESNLLRRLGDPCWAGECREDVGLFE